MSEYRVIKILAGKASLDGVATVTCESLPPVRVAIVAHGGEFHGVPLVQVIPSEEWEGEFNVKQLDLAQIDIKCRGMASLELAEERSQRWADARVGEILAATSAELEVQ